MSTLSPGSWERVNALCDAARLMLFHILIVGAGGRVGMALLRHLLTLPFQRITAIDADMISERDAFLFPASTIAAGERFKVRGARRLVKVIRPDIKFEPVLMQVNRAHRRRLQKLIARAGFIFWLADDWPALLDAVDLFHSQVPAVGIAMGEQGAYAEGAWSSPGQTPCLACTLKAREKVSESGAPSMQIDVDAVAGVAVKVAMGLMLAGHRGFEHFSSLLDPSHPLIVVQNRDNAFSKSSNPLVPSLTRLVRVDASCDVCRIRPNS